MFVVVVECPFLWFVLCDWVLCGLSCVCVFLFCMAVVSSLYCGMCFVVGSVDRVCDVFSGLMCGMMCL